MFKRHGRALSLNQCEAAPSKLSALVALVLVLALASCGAQATVGDGASTAVIVQVRPPVAQVAVGESVVFDASVTGTALTSVTWSVQEGAVGGAVTASGVYTAPSTEGTFHVVATSAADAAFRATAQVEVAAAPPPPAAGTWQNISPPQAGPAPYGSDGAAFHYGFGPIGGAVPAAPQTLYVADDNGDTSKNGVYKSTDGGTTWSRCSSGPGNILQSLPIGGMAVDPTDANVVYLATFKGSGGLMKSTDGGTTWSSSLLPASYQQDLYSVKIDPQNHRHLILTTHSPGALYESLDAGATWVSHTSVPVTAGTYAFFLGTKDDGSIDAAGQWWILATQYNGIYRSTDGGTTWSQVATFNMTHGMESLYRASSGALYLGSVGEIYRSLDNGRTWAPTGAVSSGDGYGGIIGDGTYVWAMLANTGAVAVTPASNMRWQVLAETDTTSTPAASHWTFYNAQQFTDGPFGMVYDAANRVVYSSNWGGGVWRLKLP